MMHLVVTRGPEKDGAIIGELKIEGVVHKRIFTLEDPWNNNERGNSCIPEGFYHVEPWSWQAGARTKYRCVWHVKDVPGRSAILIHNGNIARDTQGCILVGMSRGNLNGVPAVLSSLTALNMLRSIIGAQPCTLTIKRGETT